MPRVTLIQARNDRYAWCAWVMLLGVFCVRVSFHDLPTITSHYTDAGQRWIAGEALYNDRGEGFLYLPHAAILHVPFALLPHATGEILWRLLTIGVFALGLRRLCDLSEREHGINLYPLATCIALPLGFSAAQNGQTTTLITGLTMLAVTDVVDHRWNRAATLLCLALAFKPIGLPFLMVIGALHPPMLWRLFLGLLLLAVSPYLAQEWGYVSEQYHAFAVSLRAAAAVGVSKPWAQLFGMFQLAGFGIPVKLQTPLRAAAAGAVLGLNWLTCRRLAANRYGIYLFSLTAGYVLLFSPRTENNTYAFLAPAVGLCCAEAILVQRNRWFAALLTLIALGTLGGYEVSVRIAPSVRPLWLTPLMTVCFLAAQSVQLWREFHPQNHVGEENPSPPVRTTKRADERVKQGNEPAGVPAACRLR
jgi:hypothetical protein